MLEFVIAIYGDDEFDLVSNDFDLTESQQVLSRLGDRLDSDFDYMMHKFDDILQFNDVNQEFGTGHDNIQPQTALKSDADLTTRLNQNSAKGYDYRKHFNYQFRY